MRLVAVAVLRGKYRRRGQPFFVINESESGVDIRKTEIN